MEKNKIGLTLGYFLAAIHLIWALAVWIIPTQLQKGINWMFELHGIQPYWIITSITVINAILLVVVTFIAGYVLGGVFAWLHNLANKKK